MHQDIIVALLSQLDVIGGAVLAISYGFLMLPSALGYLFGAAGGIFTGSVTPVSFMYESLALSHGLSKIFKERISMIIWAALFTGLLGVFGLPQLIVDNVGQDLFLAMLAGVGFYLAKVGVDLSRENLKIGVPTFITAVITQIITQDLIWVMTLSIPLGVIINYFLGGTGVDEVVKKKSKEYQNTPFSDLIKKEFKLIKPFFNKNILIGTLALSTLTIGGNIAYTATNSQLSNTQPTYNQSTVISSIADFGSSAFGGANMELIISPTAASPNPVLSATLFMVLAAIILITGFIYKIAKYIPTSAMGGYLFVIGAMIILPYNISDAFSAGDPVVVSLTIVITFFTNPFYGLTSGFLLKQLMIFSG